MSVNKHAEEAADRFIASLGNTFQRIDDGTVRDSLKEIITAACEKHCKERVESSQQWYAERWERMKEWARTEAPAEFRDQFFNILANGTREVWEPPTYAVILNGAKHKLEAAEQQLAAKEAEVEDAKHALRKLSVFHPDEPLSGRIQCALALVECMNGIEKKREAEITTLRAQNEGLKALLHRFAVHPYSCPAKLSDRECTCGLSAALAQPEAG